MKYTYTNGKDPDFQYLCSELDNDLNELAGGEENRKQYIEHNMLDDIHDVFIAYNGYTPVGCASFKEFSIGVAEVKRVYVSKGHRGQGISKHLMKMLEDKAREMGYHKLILETGKKLECANGLYKSLGYQVISNYGQYENMDDSICFKKAL